MNLQHDIMVYEMAQKSHLHKTRLYYEGLSLKQAMDEACKGFSPKANGKINMDTHQRRVGSEACKNGLAELVEIDKKFPLKDCRTFEDIFELTEMVKNKVYRLGDLWSYDTALRIGFNLRLYPRHVYIQSGVIKGAKKALKERYAYSRFLPLEIFPKEIQKLKPYEAENFLCIWGKSGKQTSC